MPTLLAIIHFSDLHFIPFLQNISNSVASTIYRGVSPHDYFLCQSLADTIDGIKRNFLDIPIQLICTGDVTTTADGGAFEEVFNFLYWKKYVTDKIKVGINNDKEVLFVPGNHDTWYRRSGVFSSWKNREDEMTNYFSGIFPDHRIIPDSSGRYFTFILLDSNRYQPKFYKLNATKISQGEVGEPQLRALANLISGLKRISNASELKLPSDYCYDSSIRIALLHHHIAIPESEEESSLTLLRDRNRIIDELVRHEIKIVFCGHKHFPYRIPNVQNQNILLSCAGSATQLNEEKNSFSLYLFNTNEIEIVDYRASSKFEEFDFDVYCSERYEIPDCP